MKYLKYVKNLIRNIKQLRYQQKYRIQFYNCWPQPNEEMYWHQFITSRGFVDTNRIKFAIFSVFGPSSIIDKVHADIKIFFSAENVKKIQYNEYQDYLLDSQSIDLSLGFDYISNPKYIRFPLWMDYMFPANSTKDDIKQICKSLRHPSLLNKTKFCSQVSSHDNNGIRMKIISELQTLGPISCAGMFNHNDDSLQLEFSDNKIEYLKQFLFNICPENTDSSGYVTEKLFEAIKAGCIPIYWGAEGNPEPEVINKDATIIISEQGLDSRQKGLIEELLTNPKILQDFLAQPRLLPTAEEYILDTFGSIENRLRDIVQNKCFPLSPS